MIQDMFPLVGSLVACIITLETFQTHSEKITFRE
jgi:hypothetical protein